jgi:hypothetical protein
MRFIATLRWLPVVGALGFVLGCRDAQKAVATDFDIPTPGEAGLYPSLGVTVSDDATVANLALLQVGSAFDVASYQGEVQYDVKALKLVEASFPHAVNGAVFEVSPGRLRFVGTADAGLGAAPLLTLRFGAGGEIKRGAVNVLLEEVTAAGDLADLTAQVKNGTLLLRKVE